MHAMGHRGAGSSMLPHWSKQTALAGREQLRLQQQELTVQGGGRLLRLRSLLGGATTGRLMTVRVGKISSPHPSPRLSSWKMSSVGGSATVSACADCTMPCRLLGSGSSSSCP